MKRGAVSWKANHAGLVPAKIKPMEARTMLALDNPILYREQRAKIARNRRLPWWKRINNAGLLLVWLVPMFISLACTRGRYAPPLIDVLCTSAIVSLYLQILYVCMRSLVVGSAAIARERDLQTWETLLSTPIGLERMVRGKYLAVVLPLLTEILVISPFLLVFLWPKGGYDSLRINATMLGEVLLLNVICVFAFSTLGLLISTFSASTTRAASRAVVASLILVAGTWLTDVLLGAFSQTDPTPLLSVLNPYVALTAFLNSGHGGTGFLNPALGFGTIGLYLFATAIMMSMVSERLRRESVR